MFYYAAVAALLACSCEKNQVVGNDVNESAGEANLSFSIALPDEGTKASYADARDYENKIAGVQVLVFDGVTGNIDKVFPVGSSMKGSVSTTLGKKKIWAIANPPIDYYEIANENDLKNQVVSLGDNIMAGKLFVMAGSEEVQLTAGGDTVEVNVSRLASRVCLNKVSVALPAKYQEVELSYVYLSNVREYKNYGGDKQTDSWVNRLGRVNSSIIDGETVTASIEGLTASKPAEVIENGSSYQPSVPILLYAMPNGSAPTDLITTLVAVVKIEGKKYYYPVVLNSAPLKSNESYSVSMTIASLGSDDPNKPVEKSALDVEINVEPWASGAEYNEVI